MIDKSIRHDTRGLFQELVNVSGDNPQREGLKDTSQRAAAAFRFLTQGYNQDIKEVVNGAVFTCKNDNIVVVKDIEFYSLCEHHMLPMIGKCHIGYVPNGKIIGLSKIARVVDVFSRRLQIQENLTMQIAQSLRTILKPKGIGVVIEANHLCMMMRGIQKQHSFMVTMAMLGLFKKDQKVQEDFMRSFSLT